MKELTSERLESGRLALRFISDSSNRARLKSSGVGPTTPMIACEWDTPVGEVHSMLRMQNGQSKVLIAIRRESTIYTLMASADEPEVKQFLKSTDLHPGSEIGMVYDTLTAPKKGSKLSRMSNLPAPERFLGQYSLALA